MYQKLGMKKIIFFDGDGTLWYPRKTKRTRKPFWVYSDPHINGDYLPHLTLTPSVEQTLQELRRRGVYTCILSTHPDSLHEAHLVLKKKVDYFHLQDLFDEIHATAEYPSAKGEVILSVLNRLSLKNEDALMVGDSFRWDYQPAVQAGIECALINSAYHQENILDEPCRITIQEIDEVLDLV